MSTPAFEDFCRRLCDALGVTTAPVASCPDSPSAICMEHRGVTLVLSDPAGDRATSGWVSMLVDFGEVPEDEEAQVYAALLQANFLMINAGAPSFSLHPANGRVTYHIALRLDQADPLVLAGALDDIAACVLQWRETRLLMPEVGAGIPPAAISHALRA